MAIDPITRRKIGPHLKTGPKTVPEDIRFWRYVEIPDPDGCWMWTGHTMTSGYGNFGVGVAPKGKTMPKLGAHIWVYRYLIGEVPKGMHVHHDVCQNKLCCNPWHMALRTNPAHALEPDSIAGINLAKTHCPKGHEYTPENTRVRTQIRAGRVPSMTRSCRTCDRISGAKITAQRTLARRCEKA